MPHGLGQVGGCNEKHVDVVYGQDLFQVLQRLYLFQQHNHHRLVVGGLEVVGHAEGLPPAKHAPVADGSILGGKSRLLGGLAAVDVGDDDSHAAAVEGSRYQPGVVGVYSGDGRQSPEIARPRHVAQCIPVHGTVLALDPGGIESHRA